MQKLAGRTWYYEFREIGQEFSDPSCSEVATKILNRCAKLTKKWNAELNSEWTCRLFMAAKLVMAATLHVNASYFADSHNLRVVIPYLRYYSVLSLMRAVCYTHPDHDWKNGQLIQISHAKAIDGVINQLHRFDQSYADSAGRLVRELKAERELISYRAPSSGDQLFAGQNQFLSLCTLLAEVAQFNSELFEVSLLKHADRRNSDYSQNIWRKLLALKSMDIISETVKTPIA